MTKLLECVTCAFAVYPEPTSKYTMECRQRPPAFDAGSMVGRFPRIYPSMWCGQWRTAGLYEIELRRQRYEG